MNKDLLIAKLIEGTISEEESKLLNSELNVDPMLKDELSGIKEIDKLLSEPVSLNSVDMSFLSNTFSSVTTTTGMVSGGIASGTAAGAGSAATGATGTLVATKGILTGISGGFIASSLGIVAVASTFVYMLNTGVFEEKPVEKVQVQNVITLPSAQNQAVITETPKQVNKEERKTQETPKLQDKKAEIKVESPKQEIALNTTPKQLKEVEANATIKTNNSTNNLLQETQELLNNALASNDNNKVANLYKKLGVMQKKNSIEVAITNLNKAVEYGNKSNSKELVAEAYGEMALIEFTKGSMMAKERAKQCLELLKSIKSTKLTSWENKLEKIK